MHTETKIPSFSDVFLLEDSKYVFQMVRAFAIGLLGTIATVVISGITMNSHYLWFGLVSFIAGTLACSWIGAGADIKGQAILGNIASNVEKKYGISGALDGKSLPENYWKELDKTKAYTFVTPEGKKVHEIHFLPNSEPVIVRTLI